MPIFFPNGWARATHVFKLSTDPQEMTFHLDVLESGVNPGDLAEEVYNSWQGAFLTELNNDYSFVRVDIQGRNLAGQPFEQTYGENAVGTFATGVLPSNCAAIIRKVTGVPGRVNRGRCFMPGLLDESRVAENGSLLATLLSDLQVDADAWETNLRASGTIDDFGILHEDPLVEPSIITSFQVDPVIGTQRRRLR